MRRTGSLISSFLIGLSGLAALSALTAVSAHADTITPISQLNGFGYHQMVVDSAKGYVFLSQGEPSNGTIQGYAITDPLIVTDLSGKYLATVDAGDGVEGIALSPDGGTLYAALASQSAVAAIDVSTITQATPTQTLYPMATGDVPYGIARQSGKVWVSYQPAGDSGFAGVAQVGDINLAAATPAAAFEPDSAPLPSGTTWYSAPDLAADPDDSGVLVALAPGNSLTTAATFSTTTDPATPLATPGDLGGTYTSVSCSFEYQFAVLPGGQEFVTACNSPSVHEVYSVTNLVTPASDYATAATPYGVAVDSAGDVAASISVSGYGAKSGPPAVYIYSPAGQLLNKVALDPGTSSPTPIPGYGLAWAPDGSALYAVVEDFGTSGATYSLQVIDHPLLTHATLGLSAPASVYVTKAVALSGKLALTTGAPLPAGTQVTVTRTLGTAKKTFTVTPAADGTFTLTDPSATAAGAYTYTASYAGTSAIAPTTASRTVNVIKFASGLSMALSATTINYGTTTVVTAHLAKAYTNHAVLVYAQMAGHARQLIGHGNVNSKGDFAVRYRSPYNVTYSVTYAGDARVAAAAVSHGVRVRAEVLESVSGYYGTSGSYRLYTGSETLTARVSVAPNKHGQCGRMEIDQYYQGAWAQIGLSPCFGLSSASAIVVSVKLSGLANHSGIKFRIRGDYVASSAEKLNLGNDSGWQYFMVS